MDQAVVITNGTRYFDEWSAAARRSLMRHVRLVRSTTMPVVDITRDCLYLLIGDAHHGDVAVQVREQIAAGNNKRARFILWYTERLPLPDLTLPEADEHFRRLMEHQAAFDEIHSVDRGMVEFLRGHGIEAVHSPIGYSPVFESGLPRVEPLVDVLFNGTINARRREILDAIAGTGVRVEAVNNSWSTDRAVRLACSRSYLNIHFDGYPMNENLRIVHAVANRVPVISETIAFPDPFVPGQHLVMAPAEELPGRIAAVLDEGMSLGRLAAAAYEHFRNDRTMDEIIDDMLGPDRQHRASAQREEPVPMPNDEREVPTQASGPVMVDIGCGKNKPFGYIGVDRAALPGVDIVHDIANEGIPFEDSTVDVLRAHDFLEHVEDRIFMMNEIHRVLKPGGVADIFVPSTDGRGAFQDPTHVSYWNQNSFSYYLDGGALDVLSYYGMTCRFRAVELYTTPMSPDYVCHVVAKLVAVK